MKVHELMELLSALDQHADIIIANDAEGNSFSDFAGFSDEMLVYEDQIGRYDGVYTRSDLYEDGDDDEFIDNHYREVVVLWPV